MEKLKIKSIIKGNKKQVFDLTVEDNHNFFITDKEILTHNCDYLSPNAQAALRGVMERYSNTARFILTANYPHKIIPALHSRCQGYHIEKLDLSEFIARVATILLDENIQFEIDILDMYVKSTYPDMRKCINLCQMNSQSGTLESPEEEDSSVSDYRLQMVALFKAKKYKEARTLICQQITQEEYDDIYRFMYRNLELWADNDEKEDQCILVIRNGLVKHVSCGDPEINLAATITELTMVARS